MGFLDIFFPKRCAGCGKTGGYFCRNCKVLAKPHFPQVCPVCEKASIDGFTHPKCKTKYSPDRFLAIWNYEGPVKKLIYKLKYKFVSDIASEIAPRIGEFIQENKVKKAIFVPVPLHKKRESWRGFNHTKEVGEGVAKILGWECIDLLERHKETPTQVGLKEKERKENIKGAFRIKKEGIVVQNYIPILLFDDVWTSGSTLKEATKVLKHAGYKEVVCLTIAR